MRNSLFAFPPREDAPHATAGLARSHKARQAGAQPRALSARPAATRPPQRPVPAAAPPLSGGRPQGTRERERSPEEANAQGRERGAGQQCHPSSAPRTPYPPRACCRAPPSHPRPPRPAGIHASPARHQPAAEAGRCWLPPSCGRGTTNPNRLRSRAELPAGASRQPCGTPHRPTSATPCGSPGVRSVGGALRWRRVGTGASFPQGFLAVLGARGPQAGSAAPAAGEAGRAGEGGEGAAAALAGA